MKKVFILLTAALFAANVSAQEDVLTNKKGQPILPKAGDFGLSIDATPMLKYVGGIFSDTDANTDNLFGRDDFRIQGQYFLQNNRSVIVGLNLGFGSSKETYTNEDSYKYSNSHFGIDAGYAFHRGYGRLQATYGPQIELGFGRGFKETWEYKDALSATNSGPRDTEEKSGFGFNIGVGAFVGIEYFIAPRISVGGSVGLSVFNFESVGAGSTTTEEWDSDNNRVKTTETETGKSNGFGIFQTKAQGNLSVNLYF